uniref:Uncharacterized protein n=1 Tax=viral metagenome TaxID=1070528 RepID=A0A2V0RJ09_9ZZZZ
MLRDNELSREVAANPTTKHRDCKVVTILMQPHNLDVAVGFKLSIPRGRDFDVYWVLVYLEKTSSQQGVFYQSNSVQLLSSETQFRWQFRNVFSTFDRQSLLTRWFKGELTPTLPHPDQVEYLTAIALDAIQRSCGLLLEARMQSSDALLQVLENMEDDWMENTVNLDDILASDPN